jgi:hypothetical protein
MASMVDIENGIKTLLDSTNITTIKAVFSDSKIIAEAPDQNRLPAIAWCCRSGKFSGHMMTQLTNTVIVQFVMIFLNHKNEQAVRHAVYPVLEALAQFLNGKLSTITTGLQPGAWDPVDIITQNNIGTMAFRLNCTTSYEVDIDDEDDTSAALEEILNKYEIEDAIILEHDLVDLT